MEHRVSALALCSESKTILLKELVLEVQLSSQIKIDDLPPGQSRVYARINYAKSLACLKQKEPQAENSWKDIADQIHGAIEDSKNLEAKRDLEDRHLLSYAIGNLGGLYEYLEQVKPQPQVPEFKELCPKKEKFSINSHLAPVQKN